VRPAERAEIYRPVRDTRPAAPSPAVEPVDFDLWTEFAAGAPAELRPALNKGPETVSLLTLVVQWSGPPELFRSARAQLTEGFEPLLASIGAVIAANQELTGTVTVVGHTDSVAGSNPFGDNQGLSDARAATVAAILVANGVPADRVRSVGRAATEPVASNATKEGRALNRRVEIMIEKRL